MTCGDRHIKMMCLLAMITKKLYESPEEFEKYIKIVFGDKAKKSEDQGRESLW